MPFTTNRGQRIHYTLDGEGPLVLLQHGYLSSAEDWRRFGYVDVLTEAGFQVAAVDSLAHGESDKPTDPEAYALPHRAADLVAVMDDVGVDQAHVAGYSMGGWIAGGVAEHHADRLRSVTIAGWDCVRGTATAAELLDLEVTAELMLEGARNIAPELTEWVTPEVEEAVIVCGNAIVGQDADASAAVNALDVPVLLWNGTEDPYDGTMRAFAEANGYTYFNVPGDHLGAFYLQAREAATQMATFFSHSR